MATNENPQVSVDAGDLSELEQSSQAWASFLRERAQQKREDRYYGVSRSSHFDDEAAADRIDQAASRTRQAFHDQVATA